MISSFADVQKLNFNLYKLGFISFSSNVKEQFINEKYTYIIAPFSLEKL